MKRVYISDLDFTLTQKDASLSSFSKSAINHILASNIPFTIASARSIFAIQKIVGNLPFSLPIIEFNGAYLSDLQTGKHLEVQSLSSHLVQEIWNLGLNFGLTALISAYDGKEDHLYHPSQMSEGMQRYIQNQNYLQDPRLRPLSTISQMIEEQIVCMTFISTFDPLIKIKKILDIHYKHQLTSFFYPNEYNPNDFWLTIYNHKIGKGQAIQRLIKCAQLNDYEIVVFGDNLNDLEMFRIAHRSYAVENAIEELKTHATGVIGPHHLDSVVKFILAENDLSF